MRKLLWAAVILIPPLLYLGWTAADIWQTSKIDDRSKSDAIVVMGAAQYDGRPSPIFRARLDHAFTLYESGVAPLIVVLGGKQPGDRFTEAQAGAAYLEERLPADKVTGVKSGSTTLDSLKKLTGLAGERGIETITLVSDPLHLARAKEMAEGQRFEVRVSGSRLPESVERKRGELLRETVRITYYRIFKDG